MKNCRLLTASLLGASALTFAMPAQAQRVDHIVGFGDSYADSGNAFALIGSNPYYPIYPQNRFSSGLNYIDLLADTLDVPLDNFAIGGATTGYNNVALGLGPGFSFEVDQFLGVGAQSPVFPTISTFDENDLVAVSIGGNDGRAYQQGGGTVGGATTAAATSVAQATYNLDRLVDAGAQNISFLAGDTSRLPEVNYYPDPAGAAAVRSAFSASFASGIQNTLAGYAADGVMVHYLDLNLVLDNVLANPAAYGITKGIACPSFPPPAGPVVDPAYATCIINASGYMFYGDQLHLTQDGYAIIAKYVAAQLTAPLVLQAPSDVALDVARQFGRTLTSRMDTGSPRDGETAEGLKFFIVGDGYSRHLDAGERNLDYRASGVGATAGVEFGFGTGVAGVAVNYSKPKANFTSDAADVDSRSIQVGGYAGFGLGGAFVQGYAGYGWDKHDIDRAGVVEGMDANNTKGHHFLIGAKGGYLMPMGIFRVGPVLALDYAKAKVDGYTESGDPALALNVDSLSYKSLRGSAGIEVRSDFEGGGVQLRPFVSAMVEKDFSGDGRTIRFAQTSAPTIVNSFGLSDASKKAYGRFSAGFGAAILTGVSLDIAGSATIGKDQGEETSAHLGVRIGF